MSTEPVAWVLRPWRPQPQGGTSIAVAPPDTIGGDRWRSYVPSPIPGEHDGETDATDSVSAGRTEIAFSEADLALACAGVAAATRTAEKEQAWSRLAQLQSATLLACTDAIVVGQALLQRVQAEVAERASALVLSACAAEPQAPEALSALVCLVEATLQETASEPALKVRASAASRDWLEPLLAQAAAAAGFNGDIRLSTDAGLADGVVRVDWQSGWAECDMGAAGRLLRARLPAALQAPVVIIGQEESER